MKIGKRGEPKRRFAWVLPFFWGTQNHVQGRPYETSCFFMAWTVGRIIQYMESRGAMAPRPLFQVPWTWGKFCLLLVCSVTAEGKWSASGYAGYGCSWLEAMMMSFLALLRLTHTHIHSKITSCFDKLKQKRTETVPSFFRPVDSLSTPTGSLRLCRGRVVCPKTKSPRPWKCAWSAWRRWSRLANPSTNIYDMNQYDLMVTW